MPMDGTTKCQRTEDGGWWCHADHKWCGDGRDGDWWKSDEWWVRREDQQQDRQGRQGGGQRVPTPPPPPAAESDPAAHAEMLASVKEVVWALRLAIF